MRRQQGFTLIELLIVIIIVGVASTILVLNVGNIYLSSRRTEFFAREMARLIDVARNRAIFGLEVIGLRFSPTEYTFVRLAEADNQMIWSPLGGGDRFWTRRIPQGISVQYQVQGTEQESSFSTAGDKPQIIFLSSGEMTPFIISIQYQGARKNYVIKGTYTGNVSVTETD